MNLNGRIYKQFEKPTGSFGKIVGWMMSVSNKEMVAWMIEKLNLSADNHVLEVGFGTGDAIYAIAGKLTTGSIEGVDHSRVMYQRALKKNTAYVSTHKAKLHFGDIRAVHYEKQFDIICGSNIHFFWENPVEELSHLYSLLKPGGRIVLTFQPRWVKSDDEIHILSSILYEQYQLAGFSQIEIDFKPMRPVTCIYISGTKRYYE